MKSVLIAINLFSFFFSFKSQINYINTGTQDVLKISLINENIVVFGDKSYLVKSYDNCSSLISLQTPEASNLNYLARIDTQTFYMTTSNSVSSGKIYKSTDGGYSWNQKYSSNSFYPYLPTFFDKYEGIVFTNLYQKSRTIDGGNTWISESSPDIGATATETYGDSLIILGTTNGAFVVSKDRGHTWSFGGSFPFQQARPNSFFILNKDTVFSTSTPWNLGAYFARSYNGGLNWQTNLIPLYKPNDIYFKNAKEGYVVGSGIDSVGVILKTDDLGESWYYFNTQIKSNLTDIRALNDTTFLISGSSGVLFKWNYRQTIFTGITDYTKHNLLVEVYPNPVKDKLQLQYDNTINLKKVSIFNALCQEFFWIDDPKKEEEIDLSSLQRGLYFVELSAVDGRKRTFKVIKE